MYFLSAPNPMPPSCHNAVVALGNFDGLHQGHQIVLAAAQKIAKDTGKPFGVMTFEPHPRRLFFPNHPPFRITPAPIKKRLLADSGVDVLFEIPFTPDFSKMTADDFIETLLVKDYQISHAVAGHDFVFGYKRGGDIAKLKTALAARGIGVTEITPQKNADGALWSSTMVRTFLQQGDVRAVTRMLGRHWEIEGVVEHGDKRGGAIGFPTANIALGEIIRPRFGVYAVQVQTPSGLYKGVANFGVRPTVGGDVEKLEVHLFDMSGDFYGQTFNVHFIDFIRAEQAFSSLDGLKAQIEKDCLAAKFILN